MAREAIGRGPTVPKKKGKKRPVYLGGNVPVEKTKPPKGASFLGRRPSLVPNISPEVIAKEATEEGARSLAELTKSYNPLFATLAKQQRGQINELSSKLDNQYTQDARQALGASMASAGTMEDMASEELALGRSLSPEQLRQATQSARQAFSARGLGTGLGSAAAELLSRDAFASQRERERRTFASGLLESSGTMRQRGAAILPEIDPYSRAMNPGLALGQSAQQFGLNTAGNQFGRGMELFGGASTFNVNRMDNLRTNWMDNAAGVMGANRQAGATKAAANAAKPKWYETALGAVSNIFG
jgi:hypothetical protein